MNRRFFVSALAGAGALGAQAPAPAPARKTRLYRLDYFQYRQGDQATRLSQFFESMMPLFTKHIRTVGAFTAVMSPRTQTMLALTGFSSYEEMSETAAKIEGDAAFQKASEELERGAEPPYDTAERVLLSATDFSPEIVPLAEKPKSPRYFELRVYHSPTQRQLRLVHERFSGSEIKIFHRSGVHPIFYSDTIIGPEMPNLTYMIPFSSLAEREKAWDAFGADPEWTKVRAESIARGGQIVNYNNISLWRATAFSPIQ
jgi:hypothetical protein